MHPAGRAYSETSNSSAIATYIPRLKICLNFFYERIKVDSFSCILSSMILGLVYRTITTCNTYTAFWNFKAFVYINHCGDVWCQIFISSHYLNSPDLFEIQSQQKSMIWSFHYVCLLERLSRKHSDRQLRGLILCYRVLIDTMRK